MDPSDYVICKRCDGSGLIVDERKQDTVSCPACGGEGFVKRR